MYIGEGLKTSCLYLVLEFFFSCLALVEMCLGTPSWLLLVWLCPWLQVEICANFPLVWFVVQLFVG